MMVLEPIKLDDRDSTATGDFRPLRASGGFGAVKGGNRMRPKLGLCGISYLGLWYDGPSLGVREFVSRAKRFGYEGVELCGKAPQALPYLLNDRDRKEIVELLAEEEMELIGVSGYNDFSSPVTEHRDANIQLVIAQIRLCRDLGAPILRVYTAGKGSGRLNGRGTYAVARVGYDMAFPQTPEMDRWKYCLECFRIVARVAEDEGVILALQNHPPVVRNSADCLAFVEEVDSPNFRLSFDISGERAWQETGWILQQARRMGDLWVRAVYGGDFKRNADGTVERVPLGRPLSPTGGGMSQNHEAWVQAMFEVDYRGFVSYEACTPTYLSNGELVPIEVIDQRVEMGRDFIQALFDKYESKES